jgi:hypothetical protein
LWRTRGFASQSATATPRRLRFCLEHRLLEGLHGAEEERPFDGVDHDALGQGLQPLPGQLLGQVAAVLLLHLDALRHAPHEVQGGQDHADVDRHHEVGEHREGEGGEQDRHVRPRRAAQHVDEVLGLAHVPGHQEEDRREGGDRHVHEQRRRGEQDQEQREAVHQARQGARAAGPYIGGGAGDGAGGGDAAEQRREQVGEALADQLLVGVVLGAGHAVCHHRREQGLDGAEHGDGEGRADELEDARQSEGRELEGREPPGDPAEGGAQGRDTLEVEGALGQGRRQHGDQRAGQALQARQHGCDHYDEQAREREHGGGRMEMRQRLQEMPELLVEMRARGFRQPEEVRPLAHEDDDADAGGEP